MQYKHFDLLVEEMSEEQAAQLLREIIAKVEEEKLHIGGGYTSITDADLEFWPMVRGHVDAVVKEFRMVFDEWWESVVRPIRLPWE